MEAFFKYIIVLLQSTKALWLVLVGAGIAIFAHSRTTKLTNESNQREKSKQFSIETNREKINALKQLYELIQEISSLYSIYMMRVRYKIIRKQRDSLADDVEEIKIKIIEKSCKASMLVQFYAIEKNVTFNHYQDMVKKGFRIWDTYQLVETTNDNFLHRLTKAYLELIDKNHAVLKQYETALSFRIGSTARKYIYDINSYQENFELIGE